MEFEERNKKPEESSKSLPMAVLITLIAVVVLLLYMGWQMISDDPSNVSDMNEKVEVIRTEDDEIAADDLEMSNEEIETVSEPITQKEEEVSKQTEVSNAPLGKESTSHKVTNGETLFSISKRYNVSENTLIAMNSGLDAKSLKVGNSIAVPIAAIHTVGPGDILRVVADKYGITVDALMKANGKTKNYAERGEKLIIPIK